MGLVDHCCSHWLEVCQINCCEPLWFRFGAHQQQAGALIRSRSLSLLHQVLVSRPLAKRVGCIRHGRGSLQSMQRACRLLVRRGGEVCSEDFGGLIEGNYGPPILQNDRRVEDKVRQERPRTPRFCDFGGMSRDRVTI